MTLNPALFTTSAADGVDTTKLRPSNWNRLVQILTSLFDGADASGSILLRDATDVTDGALWLPDVAAGSVLVSGGVGAAPAWSPTPTLTSVTVAAGAGGQTGRAAVQIFSSFAAASNVNTGETDLITFSLPANTLAVNGQKVRITVGGSLASNANAKTIKLYFGSNVLVTDNGTINGGGFRLTAEVVRTGAATQVANSTSMMLRALLNGSTNPSETLANAITIKATGQSGVQSGDITAKYMIVEWLPE